MISSVTTMKPSPSLMLLLTTMLASSALIKGCNVCPTGSRIKKLATLPKAAADLIRAQGIDGIDLGGMVELPNRIPCILADLLLEEAEMEDGLCSRFQTSGVADQCCLGFSTPTCSLCADSELPEPDLVPGVFARGTQDATCEELEFLFQGSSPDQCVGYQSTIDRDCGCPNPPALSCPLCREGFHLRDVAQESPGREIAGLAVGCGISEAIAQESNEACLRERELNAGTCCIRNSRLLRGMAENEAMLG